MDTNHHSAGCFCSIEVSGPFDSYDILEDSLGHLHPYRFEETESLFYYDQPIVSIGQVPGDSRPRLDILVDDRSAGAEGTRIYTEIRHNLVYDTNRSLLASLSRDGAPTLESYRLAESIIRYVRVSTQIGHPEQRHYIVTASVILADLPDSELPYPQHEPIGLPTPTTRSKER